MKRIRGILVLSLTLLFCLTMFVGCGKEKAPAKGRYIETEIKAPGNLEWIMDMKLLKDGSIATIGYEAETNSLKYYISKDKCETWEEKELKISEYDEAGAVNFNEEGELIGIFNSYTEEEHKKVEEIESLYRDDMTEDEFTNLYMDFPEPKVSLKKIKVDGTVEEIKIDNFDWSNNGYDITVIGDMLYIQVYEPEKLISIDIKEKKVQHEYKPKDDYMYGWVATEDLVILAGDNKLYKYDAKTGKSKGELKNTKALFKSGLTLVNGLDNNKIYSYSDKGVYEYDIKKEKSKQIIDGSLTSFGSGNTWVNNFIQIDKEVFIGLFNEEEGGFVIKKYEYSKEADTKPENELTLYSLYEDPILTQAIATYQKNNPDVYINFETGIDFTSEDVNTSDAIKRLNTEIMAGKGPDIMILDELPANSYINKGLLENMDSVLSEMDMTNMFENILKSAKSKDGKVYSLPLRFGVPMIFADEPEKINSLSKLAENIDNIANSSEGSVLEVYSAEEILWYFYSSSGDKWVNDNKTLNTEALKSYLENTKKIYDGVKDKHPAEKLKEHEELLEEMKTYLEESEFSYGEGAYYNYYDYMSVASNTAAKIGISTITSLDELQNIEAVKEKYGKCNYSKWVGDDINGVYPMGSIAINAKSKEKSRAKDFIKTLFTEEYQRMNNYYGLSLNKNVFMESMNKDEENMGSMSWYSEDGNEEYTLELKPISEEVKKNFIATVESYDKVINPDKDILRKVSEELAAYIDGKASMEDTIKAVEKKLEIYLAE